MIQKTIDGGKTWKQYSLTYDDIRKVRFPSQDIGYFLTNNKLYKSLDNGTNWSEKYNFKEAIYNTHFFSKDKIIVTGINKIYKSLDGGTTWKTIVPNNNLFSYVTITALSFLDENTGYISGNYNGLDQFVSTTKDGGETWTLISKNDFSVYDFHFFDAKNAIGLRGGDLYQTTDGALNWKKTYEIYGNLTQINIVADSIVYISGEFNTVLKSTNKGKTWRELKTTYDHLKSIYFINPNTGFASGEYGRFFQTFNGGNTWKDYYLGSTFYSLYANSTNVFGSGDYGVIRKSKFTVDEFGASASLAENISSSEATLTGWLFTNTTEITNVKFEYGINSANLTKVTSATPTIVSLSNDAPRILVRNLLPKTNYIYFISYDYKGKHYETNRVTFKTLSEVDITEFYTYNLGSKQTSLVSKVTSRNKSVTELTFEYGKNKTLSEKVIPRPDSVKAKTQANIEAEITGLTPDTDYIARLKTKSNGQVYYSDTLKFRTQSRYTLQIQEPRLNNPSFQLQGTVYAPDDSVKNMFFEYDTTKFFTNPKVATISPNFTISRRNYYFNSQLPNLDSTKVYYARFRAKVEKEDITGPIQFFTLQKKIIIMPLESTFLPPNQVTLNSMVYSSGKNLYNIKFFYGENGQLSDSVWASPNSIYGYGTFRPQAILKSLKPNTIYTGRIKGTAENKTVLSDKFTFYNGVVTSVEEDKNLDITIFPNPSSGIINITTNEKIIKYEVLKIDGTLLKELPPDTEKINISDLQSGIYILRVYLKMQAKSFKIIKF